MKEYEGKCLEELRIEDYLANRKGPQPGSMPAAGGMFGGSTSTSVFGTPTSQPQSSGLFGQQPTTNTLGGFGAQTSTFGQQPNSAFGQAQQPQSVFGKPQTSTFGQPTSTFGQPQQSTGLFGKSFATPVTSAGGFSSFGAPAANASPFGAKPFGQPATGGLFGSPASAPTSSAFGQTNSFGGFGQQQQQQQQSNTSQPAPLFGQAAPTTGTFFGGLTSSSAPNTGFSGFGTATNTAAGSGSLFGQKPATGFGAAPAFNAATSNPSGSFGLGTFTPASTGFGSFGQTNTFNKPTLPAFGGFGTQQTTSQMGTGGLGMGSNLMGL